MPAVDHRGFRIRSHPARADHVPCRRAVDTVGIAIVLQGDLERSGCLADILEPVEHVVHHPLVILARAVMHADDRNAVLVGAGFVEPDTVFGIRQIVADGEQADGMAEVLLEPAVMLPPPWCRRTAQPAGGHLAGRRCGGEAVEVEAVDEAPRDIRFRELPRDERGNITHLSVDRFVHPDLRGDERVVEQVASDHARAVGEIVGGQQQPGRADTVGSDDHDLRARALLFTGDPVLPDGPGGTAVRTLLDPQYAGMGHKTRSCRDSLRPYRAGVKRHRSAWAAVAHAAAIAAGPAVIGFGHHACLDGPPVPAELVEGTGKTARRFGEGQWPGGAGVPRRLGGIAGKAARPKQTVDPVVMGSDVLVGDRPVRLQAVLVPLAEIRGPVARPDGAVGIGRTADGIPHQHLTGIGIDRIIIGMRADIDIRVPVRRPLPCPVVMEVGITTRLDPVALFKTDHIESRLCEDHCGNRASCAGADDQDVMDIVAAAHRSSPHFTVRSLSRSSFEISMRRTSPVRIQCPRPCVGVCVAGSNFGRS